MLEYIVGNPMYHQSWFKHVVFKCLQVDQKVCFSYNTRMKVIKLDRRYKPHKEAGYQSGLRFAGYWDDRDHITQIERICQSRLNSGWSARNSDWLAYFGKRRFSMSTPYYIMFRKESDMTFVLMCADLTKKA